MSRLFQAVLSLCKTEGGIATSPFLVNHETPTLATKNHFQVYFYRFLRVWTLTQVILWNYYHRLLEKKACIPIA
jgi:hypothetical protein